jgi:hypothetical protein
MKLQEADRTKKIKNSLFQKHVKTVSQQIKAVQQQMQLLQNEWGRVPADERGRLLLKVVGVKTKLASIISDEYK